MVRKLWYLAITATALLATLPAYATPCGSAGTTVTCQGVSYQLFETQTANPLVDNFTLSITGINGLTDTVGGRSGVQSFAFTNLAGETSTQPPAGFNLDPGGLNANGCSESGNYFCFEAQTTPSTSPALPADSSLSYSFSITAGSASDFLAWAPGFKINWIGTANNYDLVSQTLDPTPVPEFDPVGMIAGLTMLAGGLVVFRNRRTASSA